MLCQHFLGIAAELMLPRAWRHSAVKVAEGFPLWLEVEAHLELPGLRLKFFCVTGLCKRVSEASAHHKWCLGPGCNSQSCSGHDCRVSGRGGSA